MNRATRIMLFSVLGLAAIIGPSPASATIVKAIYTGTFSGVTVYKPNTGTSVQNNDEHFSLEYTFNPDSPLSGRETTGSSDKYRYASGDTADVTPSALLKIGNTTYEFEGDDLTLHTTRRENGTTEISHYVQHYEQANGYFRFAYIGTLLFLKDETDIFPLVLDAQMSAGASQILGMFADFYIEECNYVLGACDLMDDENYTLTRGSLRVNSYEVRVGSVTSVPLPATLPLFAIALAATGLLYRRKSKYAE